MLPILFESSVECKYSIYLEKSKKYPLIVKQKDKDGNSITLINGIEGIIAKKGMTLIRMAKMGNISLKDFLNFNDIHSNHKVMPGQVYYFKSISLVYLW